MFYKKLESPFGIALWRSRSGYNRRGGGVSQP